MAEGHTLLATLAQWWLTHFGYAPLCGREGDHYYALDTDFDICTTGATPDEALTALDEMQVAYFASNGAEYRRVSKWYVLRLYLKGARRARF